MEAPLPSVWSVKAKRSINSDIPPFTSDGSIGRTSHFRSSAVPFGVSR